MLSLRVYFELICCSLWSLLKETEGGGISSNGCPKENGQLPEEGEPGGTELKCDPVSKSSGRLIEFVKSLDKWVSKYIPVQMTFPVLDVLLL